MKWIVICPEGKTHAHSIEDPLALHCMPLGTLMQAVDEGRLTFVEMLADHPIVKLQRVKEANGVPDTHLGVRGRVL